MSDKIEERLKMNKRLIYKILGLILVSSGITYCYWGIDFAFCAVADGHTVQLPTVVGYYQVDPWVWWGLNYYLMLPLLIALGWLCLLIGNEMRKGD
jgi:hypothetical protein